MEREKGERGGGSRGRANAQEGRERVREERE